METSLHLQSHSWASFFEWNSSVGGVIFFPAIASDGTVYAGSNDNKLHAFNSDGSTKWTFTTELGGLDSHDRIGRYGFIGSWDNKLYALNPTNGSKQGISTRAAA